MVVFTIWIDTVNEVNTVVQNTVAQMNSPHNSVAKSDETIRSLSNRIEEIGSIVDVIKGIANQNGKGFSVVAENSQQLTEQINALIKGIKQDTASSVSLMNYAKVDAQQGLQLTDETKCGFYYQK